jgi:hypothetical protein
MRTCSECGREFRPSSRHAACPACRSRDACSCGKPKQKKSPRCWTCWIEAGQQGPSNPSWKGGRTTHHAGYVMVKTPGHPRARSRDYVFEHILVMEAHLQRYLVAGENVHHKNGVRDDNRLENLELWTRPQPPGARVEDVIAWAWEILDRYGELE